VQSYKHLSDFCKPSTWGQRKQRRTRSYARRFPLPLEDCVHAWRKWIWQNQTMKSKTIIRNVYHLNFGLLWGSSNDFYVYRFDWDCSGEDSCNHGEVFKYGIPSISAWGASLLRQFLSMSWLHGFCFRESAQKPKPGTASNELCAMNWHFVLLVLLPTMGRRYQENLWKTSGIAVQWLQPSATREDCTYHFARNLGQEDSRKGRTGDYSKSTPC